MRDDSGVKLNARRRSATFLLCVGVAFGPACAHYHNLGSLTEVETTYFEKRAAEEPFDVVMSDGAIASGRHLAAGPDSIGWNDAESDDTVRAAAGDVRRIVFFNRGQGLADGMLVGFGVGAVVGGVLGYAGGEEDCSGQEFCIDRSFGAVLGVMAIGVPAMVLGGVIGAIKGTTHVYYPAGSEMGHDD